MASSPTLASDRLNGLNIKEQAAILFIYNAEHCGTNLRTPKHYDIDRYIKLLESKEHQFKWGVMWPHNVKTILEDFKSAGRIKKIPCKKNYSDAQK